MRPDRRRPHARLGPTFFEAYRRYDLALWRWPVHFGILCVKMSRDEFLQELDEILEMPAGTLKGTEKLAELNRWDSAALLGFIALVDTHNGMRVSARQIVGCTTVDDLLALAKVGNGAN